MKKVEKKKVDVINELIENSSEISGSIAGSLIGAAIAGPFGLVIGGASGPIITKVFKTIGIEIRERFLSRREEIRIGGVYTFAINKIFDNQKKGKEIRTDISFVQENNGRSMAEEILEGIILIAQKEYEERKVKYLGNLYANICTYSKIGREHANQLIKTSNNLSYRQFCLLQIFHIDAIQKGADLKEKSEEIVLQRDVVIEIRDLQQKGLVSIPERVSFSGDNSSPFLYNDITITESGSLFCEMLSLDEIEKEELEKLKGTLKFKMNLQQ
jgi:hypothetical protein